MNHQLLYKEIPLSLYIHIPWCVQKCPYCDFNSHIGKSKFSEKSYIDRLIVDLESFSEYQDRPLHSIFIGGGTPSLFAANEIARLISSIKKNWDFTPNIEISMEANPGTLEQNNFAEFAHTGINRLSIGVQSLNATHLQKLGRIHNSDEALQAISKAKSAGFKSINVDLMYGLPNQTTAQALDDLSKIITLNPEHISWYQLTIEPNTVFFRTKPKLPNDDYIVEMELLAKQRLLDAGFFNYEISAFSKSKFFCAHNLNYWQFGDYIGIGAGAHSKISSQNKVIRKQRQRQPAIYLNKKIEAKEYTLTENDLKFEFMLNFLRLDKKLDLNFFASRTGLNKSIILKQINLAKEKGFLYEIDNCYYKTSLGKKFLNTLLEIFL